MGIVKRSNGVMCIFTDPPANLLEILSFKRLIDIALLSLVKYLILLVRHWRAANLTLISQNKLINLTSLFSGGLLSMAGKIVLNLTMFKKKSPLNTIDLKVMSSVLSSYHPV